MKKLITTFSLLAYVALFAQASVANAQSTSKTPTSVSASKAQMAQEPMSRAFTNGNNVPSSGVALEGYCPVCYIAANKAAKGKQEFSANHEGVTYWFVSADVRDTFVANPQKFVPAYGGWCALGVAMGQRFPVDPTNFKVVNGKIMLFLKNKSVDGAAIWSKDEAGNFRKAEANWPKLKG